MTVPLSLPNSLFLSVSFLSAFLTLSLFHFLFLSGLSLGLWEIPSGKDMNGLWGGVPDAHEGS